jgi:hypothetical protein
VSTYEKLQAIDKRVIYILLALSIAVPLLFPLGLPFSVGAEVKNSYDWIEKNLNKDDLVLFSYDISTGAMPELGPITTAVMAHLAKKGVKIVGIATMTDGVMMARQLYAPFEKDLPYGEKFVNLGFLAGGESGLSSFLQNPYNVFKADADGKPIESMPVMKGFKDVKDIKVMISVNCGPVGGASIEQWVRQGFVTHKKPVWVGLNAVMAPGSMPYYRSGQLTGYIAGIRGAAEYETLVGRAGLGTSAMDAQSIAHALIIIFIVLGNVGMMAIKRSKAKGGAIK